MAQWKRAGPITQMSMDRDHFLLLLLCPNLPHFETISFEKNNTVNMAFSRGTDGLCIVLISSTEVYAKVEGSIPSGSKVLAIFP